MATSPDEQPLFTDLADPVSTPTGAPRLAPDPTGTGGRRGAPLAVAAAVATLWAAVISFAPVLLLVAVGAAGSGAGLIDVLRLAGAGWLLGHGVAVQTPADRVSLVPLALTLLAVWRAARAGIHVSRATGAHRARSVGRAVAAGVTVGACYGLLGAVVAVAVATPDVTISTGAASLTLALLAGVPACLAACGHSRAGRRLWRRMPAIVADGVRGGALAAALMLAVGAAAAGIALALNGGDSAAVLGGLHAGVIGQAGVTLACLAYAPNAAVWAAAYLLGPGFAFGVGTAVNPSEVLLGPVPAVPLLAALPGGPVTRLAAALLAAPFVASLVAGWLLARRRADAGSRETRGEVGHGRAGAGWGGLLGAVALAAASAGALLTVAARASGGALGSGRLAEIGPQAWSVGLWATGLAFAGLVVGAGAARVPPRRRR